MSREVGSGLDIEFVRSQFPALRSDWAFFDNAGGSQILRPVLDRLNDYLVATNVQHGASYAVSLEASERLREATEAMALLVNAEHASEVVMGPSSTSLLSLLANCVGQELAPGDEVIVSNGDHEANIGPWMRLQSGGVTVRSWDVRAADEALHLEDLDRLLGPRTRLVAVTHTSNIFGAIQPVRAIADLVHSHGAMICVDGVAFAPHRAVDVQALDVDFYALSFYKLFGPHHAMLYGKREHLLRLPSANHSFVPESAVPYKFQPGNVNYELSYSMLGLTDYLAELAARLGGSAATTLDFGAATTLDRNAINVAFAAISRHEQELAARLLEFLTSRPGVRVVGPEERASDVRVPLVSFRVEGVDSASIVEAVDPHRIGIRFGDFYSRRLIDDLGMCSGNGVVRVSMAHYNTIEEVERLIEVLDEVL